MYIASRLRLTALALPSFSAFMTALSESTTNQSTRYLISSNKEYSAMFIVAMTCVLMSLEVDGQSTIDLDDNGSCGSLLTSEDVANLIQEGVEKVIASKQQESTVLVEASKQSLVSVLMCE